MRDTLARRFESVAKKHPGMSYDDHLTLMELYAQPDRYRVTIQLYPKFNKGGTLRYLLEQGITHPTVSRRAQCFEGFESRPETLQNVRHSGVSPRTVPALTQLTEIAKKGYMTPTELNQTIDAVRTVEQTNMSRAHREGIKEVIVQQTGKAAKAEEDKEGWREAARGWKAAFMTQNPVHGVLASDDADEVKPN